MHKNQFLSNYIIKQFDVKKFKKMIVAFLSIVDNFQHIIIKMSITLNIRLIMKLKSVATKSQLHLKLNHS